MANSVVRLSIDSHEFDANIKRAGEALNKFFDQARKGDRTFEVLDDDALEVVKTFGKMETSSKSARGQISELTKGFTDLSLIYRRLTDEEKTSPVGKEMAKSLGELKTRIQNTKKDLADIGQELSGSKFGKFGGIIDDIGHKFGVSANLTELLTSKTALLTAGIGAAAAALYKGADAWQKYNQELSRQNQITQVTTGLNGFSADHMTDVMRALSDTYKVDFREAINAANTLMTQFGKSGDEAIRLIKDGMQGMILGDGGKLLNMIQQFAPAFRDAGISADKLVAIIHNSEGGLFSDQNMNAILMGIKNIRLMTKSTSDSLAKLGIDGQEMSRKMSDGTLTVFEALKQVATQLKDCESGSQEAGQVMQNVFGRQGAMQGMKLARAIAELNTNLEETKKQTGELGDAFAELQTANEKLNTAIRDCFEYDGWEQMTVGIKSKLLSALADVLNILDGIRETWSDLMLKMGIGSKSSVGPLGGNLSKYLPRTAVEPSAKIDELRNSQDKNAAYNRQVSAYNAQIADKRGQVAAMIPGVGMPDLMKEARNQLNAEIGELEQIRDKYIKLAKDVLNPPKAVIGGIGGSGKKNTPATEATYELLEDVRNEKPKVYDFMDATSNITASMKDLQQQLKLYKDLLANATTQSEYNMASAGISALQRQMKLQPIALEGGITIAEAEAKEMAKKLKEDLEEQFKKNPLEFSNGDKSKNSGSDTGMSIMNKMYGGISNIAGGIEQLGIKLPDGLHAVLSGIQGIATILSGISAIVSAIEVMTTVGSLPFFARGGIAHAANGLFVPGNSYSGDNVPALLNSGELILNKAAQGNLASQLQEGNGGKVSSTPYVSGEQIYLGLTNYLIRSGRGELLTARG